MVSPFVWGPGGQAITTPQQAQRQRAVAEALLAQAQSPAQNWTQGLADVTGALSGTLINNRVSEAEAAGQAGVAEALAGLSPQSGFSDIASVLSNPWVTESPGGSAIASALLQQNLQSADPMRQIQLETAQLELERMRNPQAMPLDPTSAIQNYQFLVSQGVDPTEAQGMAFGGGGTTINNLPTVGTPPAGYQNIYDDQGRILRQDPIPGGPADLEAQQLAQTEQAGQTQKERYGNVVTEDIGRALDIIESDPTFTTGVIGSALSQIGGTPANRVRNLVETVKSNVGFDRLQAMRESSPTGGALGSVTERELSLLTSAIGSLEQSNNADDLAYNLKRVNKIYMDIIHGPGNWDPEAQGAGDGWQDMGGGIRIKPIGQ